MNNRQLFQQYVAQTSLAPVGIEVSSASGNYLYGPGGKQWLDLIGGISVCNIGHCHPEVVAAITAQAQQYLHVMVYGEVVQSPQAAYAELIVKNMPETLNNVFFTNSGSEATEGALKLTRRYTGRTDVVCCHNSYHGSTLGALSVMGDEYWRNAFRPLLPGVWHCEYNSDALIDTVNSDTACVLIETVQAEAGVVLPNKQWIKKLRQKCTEVGALLILDEIQCGFGRTGSLWAFEQYDIVPDIVLLGKALGGGMPLGAFVSSQGIMSSLADGPVLGHITTFGGHPVCCAAGMAAMQVLTNEAVVAGVADKEQLFISLLQHSAIKHVSSSGLLIAVRLADATTVQQTLQRCLDAGLFSDWFLFAPDCIRIAPPLTITHDEIIKACTLLLSCLPVF